MPLLIVVLASSILVPLVIGALRYRSASDSHRTFFVLICAATASEILLLYMAISGHHNLAVMHIYSIIETILVVTYFTNEVKNASFKKGIIMSLNIVTSIAVIYAIVGNNFEQYPSIPRALDALLIIACCIYYYYELVTIGETKDPTTNGSFFVTGGIMIYFSATFITWLMMKYVIDDSMYVSALYGSHAWINAFCNLFYAYGLWISSPSLSYRS